MKFQSLLILVVLLMMVGCSDSSAESKTKISETEKDIFTEAHERITQNSILSDFMNKISNNKFDEAILLLHPKFIEVWTKDRFDRDWKDIREQLSEMWSPEATSSFTGISAQGPYEQAIYRMSSDWRSLTSVELVSMKNEGAEYIVKVHIRAPYNVKAPKSVVETTGQFLGLMLSEKYVEAVSLMTTECKKNFPAMTIKQFRPVLGNDEAEIEKHYYRFCANTVWYDAVRLNQRGDDFTFLEVILSSENNKSKIASFTFRG